MPTLAAMALGHRRRVTSERHLEAELRAGAQRSRARARGGVGHQPQTAAHPRSSASAPWAPRSACCRRDAVISSNTRTGFDCGCDHRDVALARLAGPGAPRPVLWSGTGRALPGRPSKRPPGWTPTALTRRFARPSGRWTGFPSTMRPRSARRPQGQLPVVSLAIRPGDPRHRVPGSGLCTLQLRRLLPNGAAAGAAPGLGRRRPAAPRPPGARCARAAPATAR